MIKRITEYLDCTAEKYPNKVAYIDHTREITFQQLQDDSIRIASKLLINNFFKRPVLLFMEKSISLITSFIGVAYAGNFYSPVDTKMPEERIEKVINTLQPAVVITDKAHKKQVENFITSCEIWVFEEIVESSFANYSFVNEYSKRIIDTDILYVLFTSGSTGTPKGVIINHRAVIDFTDWISQCYSFDENTVFANQAQLYFDLSIQDVYAPLRNGSTTLLIPNRLYSAPVRVWNLVLKHNVNTLVWIPSMLSLFANLDILNHVDKAPLKTVLFCGEVMPMKQLNYWINAYPKTVFANLYGPTECTEACTYYTIDRPFSDNDILPIGIPCENSDAMIIDENGNLVTEKDVIGELCIRGTCLSNGYYRDLERTADVFVQNPINQNYPEMIYKTGDLVCYNDNNELVYVSRKDFQIKIRGYRVELGEIEAAVSAIKEVAYNCCLFDEKKEEIVLIFVGNITAKEVKTLLSLKLQEYMIPSKYIKRDQMIFNMNGKVDRKILQDMYIKN